jgi:hypothetical protein
MREETTMIDLTKISLAAAADGDAASVWRIALLLVARHGSNAAEVAREFSRQPEGEPLERKIWQCVAASADDLLDAFSPTDLLYATVLLPPSGGQVAARAA